VTTGAFLKYLVLTVGASAITLAGSPVLLALLDGATSDVEWDQLSAIGQSYGGIAAIFSAVGLLALAYSVHLQTRQTRLLQLQTVREMQIQIYTLPFQHPSLMSTLTPDGASTFVQARTWHLVYLNLTVRYLEFAYLAGELTPNGLRQVLATEVFATSDGQRYWRTSRPLWAAERPRDPQRNRFMTIADAAFADATGPN
jgi:hypothetical protein